MTVKTRETLMQRAMTGKPIMGQELRDLIDTMFWLKASPEQRIAQVVQQVAGRSTPQEPAVFPDVPGTGFVKIGADRKWFTDPTVYLTQPQGDRLYFRNSLFPMDPATYLAGDRTFKNFTDSARAAFTGGDGIDITLGDIAVDNTVSRVGHQHALTLSGDVSGSGIVAGTIATTVNAIRGGVVPPPGSAGYFYWTGSSYSWVATPPPTTIALDDLADVALASVTAGQVLWYDGSVGQWINKMLGANDIPAHASRHHFDGSDPLAGQSIAGLLVTSDPTFRNISVNLLYPYDGIKLKNGKNYFDFYDKDGNSIAQILDSGLVVNLNLDVIGTFSVLGVGSTGITKVTNGVMGLAIGSDLPSHEHGASDISDASVIGIDILTSANGVAVQNRIGINDVYVNLSTIADSTGSVGASVAINLALSSGKKIIVDKGNYLIDFQIELQSNCEIIFKQNTFFTQKDASDFAQGMLSASSGKENIAIRNPDLRGSRAGTTAGAAINDGIRITGAVNVFIEDAKCSGFYGNGIRATGASSFVRIINPICSDNEQNGILIAGSSDCRIDNPECFDNGTTSLEHGIYVSVTTSGCDRMIISGISKVYRNSGSGIQVNRLSDDVVIGDVQTYENGTNGVNIASDTGASDVSVTIGSVRSFRNLFRGFYIQQGISQLKLNADKLCAYQNGREGVYLEGLTIGASIASIDAYMNGRDGVRLKDNGGTNIRDIVIGSVRSWDNSQDGDGLYNGIHLENAIRCSFGVISIRSTNMALRHAIGFKAEGSSQFASIGSGEVYGSSISDFADLSPSNNSRIGSTITGDLSSPTRSATVAASSSFVLSTTPSVILTSGSLPPGRYLVTYFARFFGGALGGSLSVNLSVSTIDYGATGRIDSESGIRDSISSSFIITLSSSSSIDLKSVLISGDVTIAEREMSIVQLLQ